MIPDWNWTAVGTIGVALFTGFLGFETRRLARESTEDVRAQWLPVVMASIPRYDENTIALGFGAFTGRPRFAEDTGTLFLPVRNVGRGPALRVNGYFEIYERKKRRRVGYAQGFPSLAPGDDLELVFPTIPEGVWFQGGQDRPPVSFVTVKYLDIAGSREHTSTITIQRADGSSRIRVVQSEYEPRKRRSLRQRSRRRLESTVRRSRGWIRRLRARR
jgi:hypothetical protein